MARYARISDGAVAEIIGLADGLEPAAAFHPDVASTMHPCGAEVGEGWTFDGSSFSAPVQAPPDKAALKAYAASKRWQIETGGITVAGVPIATDDRSKLMITGARVAAMADAAWSTSWMGADGVAYPVDAAAMVTISDAVLAHVNAAFGTQAAVFAAIEAGAITSFAAIDGADWPGSP